MKKISFEEVIKALEEGKKVLTTGERYFLYNRGKLCLYDKGNEIVSYNAEIHTSQTLYLPEEPKPFEITETGLYKTRGGRKAFVSSVNKRGWHSGCIEGIQSGTSWNLECKSICRTKPENDIVGEWDE